MVDPEMIITRPDLDRLVDLLKTPSTMPASLEPSQTLFERLNEAHVVDPWRVPQNVVTMNSIAVLIDLANGDIKTYALVYPHDANVERLKISVMAPLGSALIGCSEGDVIAFDGPAGIQRYFVQKVTFQPEERFREAADNGCTAA
jgi:regulator of nucleoside diphosphate kinase